MPDTEDLDFEGDNTTPTDISKIGEIPRQLIKVQPLKAEPIWDQQPGEPDEAYELFLHFLSLDSSERNVKAAAKDVSDRPYDYHKMLALRKHWQWKRRADAKDLSRTLEVTRKIDEERKNYLSRSKVGSERFVAELMEQAADALQNRDTEKLEELRPFLELVGGPKKLSEFLLESYKLMHGDSGVPEAGQVISALKWG